MIEHQNMDLSTLQKQRQDEKMIQDTQQLQSHLTDRKNMEMPEDQTKEKQKEENAPTLITQQVEENEQLVQNAYTQFSFAKAKKSASGNPSQIQKPAKKTFKQNREDKRLDLVAKEITPAADHVSLHMMQSLMANKQLQDNAMDLFKNDPEVHMEKDVDMRVMRNFLKGFATDKNGEPEGKKDRLRKQENIRFINDYCSGDVERRRPHLDRMMEEALSVNITEDMLTTKYLEYHAGEVQLQICKLVYFHNVYKDPINKPYFDELSQAKKDLIEYRILSRYAPLGMVMTHVCAENAVDADHFQFKRDVRDKSELEVFTIELENERQILHDELERTSRLEKELRKRNKDVK